MFAQANSEHCRHKIFNADVDHRRRAPAAVAVRHDPPHARGLAAGHGRRVLRQRGDHGGSESRRDSSPTANFVYATEGRADAHRDEVRDAQPPDRDLALSRARRPASGRRDPRRGRDRARREAEGGPVRLLGVAPAHPGLRAALGGRRPGKPGRDRLGAGDHARGADRRRLLQQRVRPPQPRRLFPRLRDERTASRGYHKPIMLAGGIGNISAAQSHKAGVPAGSAAGPPRRPGTADRHGRRRGLVDGRREPTSRTSTSTRCSAATPRCSAARRRSSTAAGSSATPTRSSRSTTSAPAGCRTRCPSSCTRAGRGARIDLRAVPNEEPRHDAARDLVQRGAGALRPRGRSGRIWSCFRAIVRARALPVRGASASRPRTAGWWSRTRRSATRRSTSIWRCCSASRRRCCATCSASSPRPHAALAGEGFAWKARCYRVLRHPAVADKTFLVAIGDRTVGGLCARDPFVGPWQVPVADCAVTLRDFDGTPGEAFAIGERSPLALIERRPPGAWRSARRSPISPRQPYASLAK